MYGMFGFSLGWKVPWQLLSTRVVKFRFISLHVSGAEWYYLTTDSPSILCSYRNNHSYPHFGNKHALRCTYVSVWGEILAQKVLPVCDRIHICLFVCAVMHYLVITYVLTWPTCTSRHYMCTSTQPYFHPATAAVNQITCSFFFKR